MLGLRLVRQLRPAHGSLQQAIKLLPASRCLLSSPLLRSPSAPSHFLEFRRTKGDNNSACDGSDWPPAQSRAAQLPSDSSVVAAKGELMESACGDTSNLERAAPAVNVESESRDVLDLDFDVSIVQTCQTPVEVNGLRDTVAWKENIVNVDITAKIDDHEFEIGAESVDSFAYGEACRLADLVTDAIVDDPSVVSVATVAVDTSKSPPRSYVVEVGVKQDDAEVRSGLLAKMQMSGISKEEINSRIGFFHHLPAEIVTYPLDAGPREWLRWRSICGVVLAVAGISGILWQSHPGDSQDSFGRGETGPATAKFYECNKAIYLAPTWYMWPGYTKIHGHMEGSRKHSSIIVPNADYFKLQMEKRAFAHQLEQEGVSRYSWTLELKLARVSNFFGAYHTILEVSYHDARFCPAK